MTAINNALGCLLTLTLAVAAFVLSGMLVGLWLRVVLVWMGQW